MTRRDDPAGAVHALVEGRVQGVGFRYSCYQEALRLGLRGWVRNTPDGNVEVWAEGTPGGCRDLAEWLWVGPSLARVSNVRCDWPQALGTYRTFSIG